MADVIVNAEVRSNVGQLNRDLKQTQQETLSIKDAFGVASSAISTAQGAMKLFGIESESTQKAILQVQSAMALNQGIQSLLKQKDSIIGIISLMGKWTGATKILGVAQKAFNLIMKANPVGLIVAGVTALIAAGQKMLSVFKSGDKEVKAIDNTFEDLGHTMDKINTKAAKMKILFQDNKRIIDDTSKSEQERLDAQNESTAEQLKLDQEALATLEERLKKNKTNLADSQSWNNYEKQRFKDGKENTEGVEMSTKRLNKHKKELQATEQAIANLQAQMHANELAHEDKITDIKSFNIEAEKKADEERAARNKRAWEQRVAAEKNLQKQIEKIEDELTLSAIEDEDERAEKRLEIELENAKEAVNSSKASQKKKNEMLLKLDEKYLDDLNKLKDEKQAEQDEKDEEKRKEFNEILIDLMDENLAAQEDAEAKSDLQRAKNKLERQKQAEALLFKDHENYLVLREQLNIKYARLEQELIDENEEKEKDGLKELQQFKLDLAAQFLDVFMTNLDTQLKSLKTEQDKEVELAEAQGKDTTAINQKYDAKKEQLARKQKRIKIAMATMDMYQSAVGAYNQAMGLPQPAGLTMAPIAAGMAVLAGMANINQILKADVGGGGGGGGGGGMNASTPAPQMMSGSFELGQTDAPEPIKAFVVTDEMTNSQSQLANIRRRATI